MYNRIFVNNVLRILNERQMTKSDLASQSGVSASFLSDLTRGQANPSLKVIEAIAKTLQTPVPLLFVRWEELDQTVFEALAESKVINHLPAGYQRISVILPEHRAFQVQEWSRKARERL